MGDGREREMRSGAGQAKRERQEVGWRAVEGSMTNQHDPHDTTTRNRRHRSRNKKHRMEPGDRYGTELITGAL